jgi:hypothetical protein
MRVVTVMLVAATLAAWVASVSGVARASQRAATVGPDRNAGFPSWSPDGKQIVFTNVRFSPTPNCDCGGPSRWWIARTSTRPAGAVHTVLPKSQIADDSPVWLAGGRLLFSRDGRLSSMKIHGGKPQRVVFPNCEEEDRCYESGFFLSPNRKIAAVTACDCGDPHSSPGIELVGLSRTRQPAVLTTALTAEEEYGSIVDEALAFSPDGTQLVFSRSGFDGWEAGPPSLMAIRLTGGDSVPLAQSGIPGASLVPNDAIQVQWSPNSAWVAYTENDYTDNTRALEVVPTMGGTPRELASCDIESSFVDFSWSPTSTLIAYGCARGETPQLMTVRPDGTQSTDVLKGRHLGYVDDGAPRWSPDGSLLAFTAYGLADNVWTVRPTGRDLIRRS